MAEGPGAAPPPHGCPGTSSARAGRAAACQGCPSQGLCAAGGPAAPDPAIEEIKEKMKIVKHKILVLSGKGGVGKSTFSAHLAHGLAKDETKQIALLDIDICGPSIPKIMGIEGEQQVTMSDITLMRISETEKDCMLRECQQAPGPYAAMLCEAMIPEYLLLAWRGKVSYHGGRNKAALPRNLMQRLSQYLQETFVEMSQEDFCSIPGHIDRIFQ